MKVLYPSSYEDGVVKTIETKPSKINIVINSALKLKEDDGGMEESLDTHSQKV